MKVRQKFGLWGHPSFGILLKFVVWSCWVITLNLTAKSEAVETWDARQRYLQHITTVKMFKEQDQDIIKPREDVSFSVELPRLQTSRPRAKPLSSWLLVLWTHTVVNTSQMTGCQFCHSTHGPIYAYKHSKLQTCCVKLWHSGNKHNITTQFHKQTS